MASDGDDVLGTVSLLFDEDSRPIKYTEKGLSFKIETIEKKLNSLYKGLQKQCKQIDEQIESQTDIKLVHQKYSKWLQLYEQYLLSSRDYYTLTGGQCDKFAMSDAVLSSFKTTTEDWMMKSMQANREVREAENGVHPYDSVSQAPGRKSSRASRPSSVRSSISSLRIREEQKRAELTTKMAALKKKQELELARVNIKMQEEELDLNTQMAITNAKSEVLDKYDNRLNGRSDSGKSVDRTPDRYGYNRIVLDNVHVANVHSHNDTQTDNHVAHVHSRNNTQNDTHVAHVQSQNGAYNDTHDIAHVSTHDTSHVTNANDTIVHVASVHTQNDTYANAHDTCTNVHVANDHALHNSAKAKYDHVPVNNVRNAHVCVPRENSTSSSCKVALDNTRTADETIISVVRQLRKPVPSIKVFSGDPLEYRRFLRQFNTKIVNNSEDNDERMNYLDQFTGGEANNIVSGFAYLDADMGYPAALQELEERYGQPEVLANAFVKRALEWPNIRADNPKSIDEFSIFLVECNNAIQSIESVKVLQYPDNMKRLVCKLPFHYHDKWRSVVQKLRDNSKPVEFRHLVEFVKTEARKVNDPTYGRNALRLDDHVNIKKGQGHKPSQLLPKSKAVHVASISDVKPEVTNLHQSEKPSDSKQQHQARGNVKVNAFMTPCMFCMNPMHPLETCHEITKLTHADRIKFLRANGMCYGCLTRGHMRKLCKRRATCSHCQGRHPSICHYDPPDNPQQADVNVSPVFTGVCTQSYDNKDHTRAGEGDTTMAIIPVTVKLKNGLHTVQTYAFLDTGSSVSFCTESLMHQLGATGKRMQITLETMGVPQTFKTFSVKGLEISNLQMENTFQLPKVYTKNRIPVTHEHIPTIEDIKPWPHLQGINLPKIKSDIELLLGNNVPDAFVPMELKTGPLGSPYAARSRLGWIVWGIMRPLELRTETPHFPVNRAEVIAVQDEEHMQYLDRLVRQTINVDFPERQIDDKRELSVEDGEFMHKVRTSMRLTDGHYYIKLPFKNEDVMFPNNEPHAMSRLRSLKHRLSSDSQFHKDYVEFMNNLFDKGYAEQVPVEELNRNDGKVWYIPHHGVYHPRKPGKLRVVFDCTSTYNGISLNNLLLPGPDLTNSLIGVLMRFRQENIALMADIESMFYQVRVPKEDTDCLRFLWWPHGEVNSEPVVFRMLVHLFGAVSSPSCSNAALKQTATDNQQEFDEATVKTVQKNFYVDDYLSAVKNEGDAIQQAKDVTSLCQRGGFHLTKWVSNSHVVMSSIPREERSKEVKQLDLEHEALPSERALGIHWNVETDILGYNFTIKDSNPTRRGILSLVSSTYDPLGLASPFVLVAKTLLQNLCSQNVGWDDEIDDVFLQTWKRWLTDLPRLTELQLDRCYKPKEFGEINTCQLHVFSDASGVGYGTVIYIRLTDHTGNVHCSFVMAKSKVSPLKKITIPRMELTAAMVGVRLAKVVLAEVEYNIDNIYFWTDSMSVIRYIRNTTTRFHTFVANRLSVIREFSGTDQWRHIDTKSNPADCASRGMTIDKLINKTEWLHGPTFLWKDEQQWPTSEISNDIPLNDLEVKTKGLAAVTVPMANTMEKLLSYHSDLHKLKKTVAWLLLAKRNLRRRCEMKREFLQEIRRTTNDEARQDEMLKQKMKDIRVTDVCEIKQILSSFHLTTDLYVEAELSLIKFVQGQHYAEEIQALRRNLATESGVGKTSTVRKLDPIIVDDILRVGGRLGRAHIDFAAQHPIILPKQSPLSTLILRDVHTVVGHLGKNMILNTLRQKYWIVGVNSAIKSLLSRCVICRKYQARAGEQKMADLPAERLSSDQPCFTNVGVDYFGPIEVKRGRTSVKRYGVIFTCMTTRAVHLEVAHAMDTDSCINAVRRFIARRGPVKMIRSDNGSNLVGSEKEMRGEINRWNQSKLHQTLLKRNITWVFNPPGGSHFGGVWERMIRSVRKILYSLLHQQVIRLDDESLQTLFCEVEAILNSRPITEIPNSIDDIEALTPNHILLLRCGEDLPPGLFEKSDMYVKRRWRQVQYLADVFWRRWTKEYLPLLQERQKWVRPRRNLQVNDIVLLVENTPRNSWSLGRVTEVIRDKKGFVRMAHVKAKGSVYLRPVDKLVFILEAEN